MSRRTTPRAKADALSFAVAVHVVVPDRGFGQLSGEITGFLNEVVGSGNFANHPGQITGVPQVTTFYFRDLEGAMMFKGRFRELKLANGLGVRTAQ